MKVLIIEDGIDKLANILKLMASINADYINKKTYQTSWQELHINHMEFDALILDLALPIFKDEIPYKLAGYNILQRLRHENISIPTIILTGYQTFTINGDITTLENLKQKIISIDPNNSYVIWYNSKEIDWENKIIDIFKREELI